MLEVKAVFMHTFPSNIEIHEGDKVIAAECRPIAKSVSFVIIEVRK